MVPTCRPESFEKFLEAWTPVFEKHDAEVYSVWDVDDERDSMPDFIPIRTDMIRSWGFYNAWRDKSRYTLTLDDDVRPFPNVDIFDEYEKVFESGAVCSPYFSVGALTTVAYEMRGFPYADRVRKTPPVQYGGWAGVLDYDAATQLSMQPGSTHGFSARVMPVPKGAPVTTCIMNTAFLTEFAPAMWQLPMLDGKYNRFGDIWSGLLQKRVLDLLDLPMVINGRAQVKHERASNVMANLERELPGIALNEDIWGVVSDPHQPADTTDLISAYRDVTTWTACMFPADYRSHFLRSRDAWLGLFA